MSITSITANPPRLTEPNEHPIGEWCRYGVAYPFQVDATTAAVLCALRNEGYPVGDFENGADVILFDDLHAIDPARVFPIVRNDKYVDVKGQRRINIHYPTIGGFIPLGAKHDDGTPHPHAGTGYGMGVALDFPQLGRGHYTKAHKRNKVLHRTWVYQFRYNGKQLFIEDTDVYDLAHPLRTLDRGSEWSMRDAGLKQAIPDGDGFLAPIDASVGDIATWEDGKGSCGVARWERRNDRWDPIDYVPIEREQGPSIWMEPSLIRDVDGTLLFTSRGAFNDVNHKVRVWRSTDGGDTWQVILEKDQVRGESPITINQAADGTPYLVTNKLGHERDWLIVLPLNDARDDLLPAIDVRNALEDFGPPPIGPFWFMDHPMGETLRLGDGLWHHVLSYRNMDRGEHAGGSPAWCTGQYLEEVFSDGPARPTWKFD